MKTETTPPKWTREALSVGRTLLTPTTRRWSKEQMEENDKREKRCVFRNFLAVDNGRSRETVAEFRQPEDAARAVAVWNAMLPIESPEKFMAEAREHCESVLAWWETAQYATTSDSGSKEHYTFDSEPKFVTESRRLLSQLNNETKGER